MSISHAHGTFYPLFSRSQRARYARQRRVVGARTPRPTLNHAGLYVLSWVCNRFCYTPSHRQLAPNMQRRCNSPYARGHNTAFPVRPDPTTRNPLLAYSPGRLRNRPYASIGRMPLDADRASSARAERAATPLSHTRHWAAARAQRGRCTATDEPW